MTRSEYLKCKFCNQPIGIVCVRRNEKCYSLGRFNAVDEEGNIISGTGMEYEPREKSLTS